MEVSFPSRLSFITGPNASGKTNILESISVLSQGKSFRGANDQDMVREGSDNYFVSCKYLRAERLFLLESGCDISGGKLQRRIKINDKRLQGRSALIGNLVTVVFSPDDLAIVDGGPGLRRKFLDSVLSNQDTGYLRNLIQYNRSLQQRNAILKKMRMNKVAYDLNAWNAGLVEFAGKLTEARLKFVEDFSDIFRDALDRISAGGDPFQIGLSLSFSEEKEDLAGVLQRQLQKDISLGYTTAGPHRHNITFRSNGRDVTRYGSQGQKRTLALALRIAQFHYLKRNLQLSPILLIDDVIRELDAGRRKAFVQLLHECGQALFTSPDLDGLEDYITDLKDEISVYTISEPGKIQVN